MAVKEMRRSFAVAAVDSGIAVAVVLVIAAAVDSVIAVVVVSVIAAAVVAEVMAAVIAEIGEAVDVVALVDEAVAEDFHEAVAVSEEVVVGGILVNPF